MVLGGLAAGVAAGACGAATSTFGNNDALGMYGNYMTNAGCNLAGQAFARKFRQIDYTIQQQQLHREDIRDLVELTVGRMDVYLIVGTLLLTFCIGWYTNNGILSSGLPTWYITLFLVSNFTAAAFLVFAVWLAMHASVASHSIGVRLLTSFARLSIPSIEEVESIQTNVLPSVSGLLNLGRQMVGLESVPQDQFTLYQEPGGAAAASAVDDEQPLLPVEEEDQKPVKGMVPEDHFKRFLAEQRRWLGYDAYSRICMCFGMNQMLQSLSYYILGIVWQVSPVSAMTSFVAVKMLGSLLLQLDVTGLDGSGKTTDQAAVLFLYLIPPVLASIVLWVPAVQEFQDKTHILGVAVCPVFLLHAGWLLYMSRELYRGTSRTHQGLVHGAAHDADFLPKRLRTVMYLNVLQQEQTDATVAQNIWEANRQVLKLQAAREHLDQLMEEAMMEEQQKMMISHHTRSNKSIKRAQAYLRRKIDEARQALALLGPERSDEEAQDEIRRAGRALDRFAVWDQAPEICAVLQAFKDQEVQGWLSEEQRCTVEMSTQDFLAKCDELGLGIEGNIDTDTSLPQTDVEKSIVHIRSYNDLTSMPSSVWVRTTNRQQTMGDLSCSGRSTWRRTASKDSMCSSALSSTGSHRMSTAESFVRSGPASSACPRAPRRRSITQANPVSFTSAFEVDLPQWSRTARDAARTDDLIVPQRRTAASSRNVSVRSLGEAEGVGAATALSFSQEDSAAPRSIPEQATPDDRLPGVLVQKLTLGTAGLWVVCAVVHAGKGLLETSRLIAPEVLHPPHVNFRTTSTLTPLTTTWPTPAHFFTVGSLQCEKHTSVQDDFHEHSVFVSSEYSTYIARRFPGELSTFSEVSEVPGRAAAVLCDNAGCSALVNTSPGSSWELQAIGEEPTRRPASVHVPSEWRHVMAAAWGSRTDTGLRQARLAAWDGYRVVVADMVAEDSQEESWSVTPRFRVSPSGHRRSRGGNNSEASAEGKGRILNFTKPQYDDVRALQFGAGTQTLLVLQGSGEVHAWDLTSGRLAVRWQVDSGKSGIFTAMCYNGQEFLLAQRLKQGPQLHVAEPPLELQSMLLPVWLRKEENASDLSDRIVIPL